MVGKAWQRAHEAAGRVVAAVRRQTETTVGAQPTSPFYSARVLSLWEGPTHSQGGSSCSS